MNSIQVLCSKCENNVPLLKLINNYTEVEIKCQCGNEQTIVLSDYLKLVKNQEKKIQYKNICESDNNIKNYYCRDCKEYFCKTCKEHNGIYQKFKTNLNKIHLMKYMKKY